MYIYICVCISICVCVCIYIYIYVNILILDIYWNMFNKFSKQIAKALLMVKRLMLIVV